MTDAYSSEWRAITENNTRFQKKLYYFVIKNKGTLLDHVEKLFLLFHCDS